MEAEIRNIRFDIKMPQAVQVDLNASPIICKLSVPDYFIDNVWDLF